MARQSIFKFNERVTTEAKDATYEFRGPVISVRNLEKKFGEHEVLKDISLSVAEGEVVSIIGPSGSGKSTLLRCATLLEQMDDGSLTYMGEKAAESINGKTVYAKPADLKKIQRHFGLVFQNFNLLPKANALKNVMVPLLYSTEREKNQKERAMEMLKMVGMEERAFHKPNELSGGQKQRVAIARAMINDPAIILADEPTGALDSKTGHMVMDLFHRLHEEQGKTIVLITHSQELATETQRIVTLLDGEIVGDNRGGEH